MISLVIKSYLTILLSVGLGSLFVFMSGLYLIFRTPRRAAKQSRGKITDLSAQAADFSIQTPRSGGLRRLSAASMDDSLTDIASIAGEDILSTQLDLAKAYIETGKTQLAKKILVSVKAQGSAVQQQEAQQLLSTI